MRWQHAAVFSRTARHRVSHSAQKALKANEQLARFAICAISKQTTYYLDLSTVNLRSRLCSGSGYNGTGIPLQLVFSPTKGTNWNREGSPSTTHLLFRHSKVNRSPLGGEVRECQYFNCRKCTSFACGKDNDSCTTNDSTKTYVSSQLEVLF